MKALITIALHLYSISAWFLVESRDISLASSWAPPLQLPNPWAYIITWSASFPSPLAFSWLGFLLPGLYCPWASSSLGFHLYQRPLLIDQRHLDPTCYTAARPCKALFSCFSLTTVIQDFCLNQDQPAPRSKLLPSTQSQFLHHHDHSLIDHTNPAYGLHQCRQCWTFMSVEIR